MATEVEATQGATESYQSWMKIRHIAIVQSAIHSTVTPGIHRHKQSDGSLLLPISVTVPHRVTLQSYIKLYMAQQSNI